jgi:hypothetical protein
MTVLSPGSWAAGRNWKPKGSRFGVKDQPVSSLAKAVTSAWV